MASRAQLSRQQNQVSTPGILPDNTAKFLGLFRVVGYYFISGGICNHRLDCATGNIRL